MPHTPRRSTSRPRRCAAAAAVLCALVLAGCAGSKPDLRAAIARADFSKAAAKLEERMTTKRSDRNYMLDRMNLLSLRLADGVPSRTEPVAAEVFDLLRTQGINDDRTTAAAILGEGGVIFWKGEPFEQALAYAAISQHKAVAGEWDNARAAALSSLFLLKDFGENERGERLSTQEIATRALKADAARERGTSDSPTYEQYLDKGYTPVKTNFALGYFLAGVANLALASSDPAREDEARDQFREAFTLRPEVKPVADALIERRVNTVFIVDAGLGPEKVGYGPDNALARFDAVTRSDNTGLALDAPGAPLPTFPQIADVNAMSRDHSWNNFEDIRQAKSTLGTVLLAGGAITAVASDDRTVQTIGLILAGAGLLLKATSAADTRHAEAFPQRTYIAVANITAPGTPVTLTAAGVRLTLPAIDPPPAGQTLALHCVRLPGPGAVPWASSGVLRYANDRFAGPVPGDDLPWILGGRCVRTPSLEVLRSYQRAGHLLDFSLADLENLYQAEGILRPGTPAQGRPSAHILEGGSSLTCPEPGSTGYVRLFCAEHPPYKPRSREVADLAARLRSPSVTN